MNDRPVNSTLAPEIRAGLAEMAQQDAEALTRRKIKATERQRQAAERREAYVATVRQTVEAFRAR
jgi:hypothetical protein